MAKGVFKFDMFSWDLKEKCFAYDACPKTGLFSISRNLFFGHGWTEELCASELVHAVLSSASMCM